MKKNATLNKVLLAALVASACAAHASAAPMHSYGSLAMSADGTRVADVESVMDEGKANHPAIVIRNAATGKVEASYENTACPACRIDFPSWSPDQKALAFIGTDSKAGTATVFVERDGKITPVVTIKGVASTARWSPDGKQIAMLATVGAKKLTGAVEAGVRQVGEIGLAQDQDEQRIGVVPASGGELKLVSPADTFVYEYDWTPDGKGFVVTSAKGNGDANWWIATLGHVDAASGQLRTIAAPKMQMNAPHVSPDGSTVAFIGGLMSDFGSVGGDVYTVPLAGGQPVDVTPGFAGSFNGFSWHGKNILASAIDGSDSALVAIDPAKHTSRVLWTGPVTSSASRDGHFVFSADGSVAAAVQEDYEHAPHIVSGHLPQLAAITHDNDSFAPQVKGQSITWKNEGFNVQGWLIGPRNADGKKHPMIVLVHGGPAAAVTPRFVAEGGRNNLTRDLVQRGYYVFMANPRGSYGQGTKFSGANKRDFGGGDWRDINTGIDAAIKAAPIDGERLGLMGHSYGGFMTMWGVTHSHRFKAAVAGAGIADWISYYGQNGINTWMIPFFGASAYDDPAVYRAESPIENIKYAKTPTLIYVGERDLECPAAQSIEFWSGLRAMGVPTKLVIYADEGHAIRKPEDQKDMHDRELAWFEQYLK